MGIPYTTKINERSVGEAITNEAHVVGIIGVGTYASLQVQLVEVPQGPAPAVTITGIGGPYTEVTSFPTMGGQFEVNYATGVVQFAAGQNGNAISVSYTGLGSEIAAQDINEVQEPLNSIIQSTLTYNPPFTSASTAWNLVPGLAVTSLNGLQDGVAIVAGSNITVTNVGNNIRIDSSGGGSTPGGAAGSVQFNVAGTSLGGDAAHFYWDSTNFRLGLFTSIPLSSFDDAGSFALPVRTVATSTSLTEADYTVLVNAASGAISVTLPVASTVPRRIYDVKKIDSSAHYVTIVASGSDTIDGAATFPIGVQYQSNTVQSNGADWFVL
jgi:hypothetical protein